MYSLTQATQLFLQHAHTGSQNGSTDVQKYNSHKIRHSIWVLETGRNLLIKIKENQNISLEMQNRAEMVFLLHDLGRFYQNNGERVLKNSEYEHGDASYKLAQVAQYDEWICLAIKYHNKYSHLPLLEEPSFLSMTPNEQEETIFLAKLARDADKLQNMIFTIFDLEWLSRLNPEVSNWDISDEIFTDLGAKKQVDRKYIKTAADDIIGVVGRFFDINFQESFEMLKYYNYLPKVFVAVEKMPWVSKEKVEKLREIYKDFM